MKWFIKTIKFKIKIIVDKLKYNIYNYYRVTNQIYNGVMKLWGNDYEKYKNV